MDVSATRTSGKSICRLTRAQICSTTSALFNLNHEILKVGRAHTWNTRGLGERRRTNRGELLSSFERQRSHVRIRKACIERELTHSA